MDTFSNVIRGLLTVTVLLTALGAVAASPLGGGMDCVSAYLRTVWEGERLDEDRVILRESSEALRGIIDRLVAGELSLSEAADALREENESRPEYLRLPDTSYPPYRSGRERFMHQLLVIVYNRMLDDPRRDDVLRRLQGEFENVSGVPGA